MLLSLKDYFYQCDRQSGEGTQSVP